MTVARADGVALTDEQQHAVARRAEPLALSAAAGSGKTSVLVERFVAAVREDGIAPAQILAITFTERAAGELRARVRRRLLELDDREAARDTEAAFVGTFHAFCARVLRAHSLEAGLDPGFAILDDGFAGRLRGLAFAQALREFLAGGRGDAVDLLAAYGVDRVRAMLEQAHAELRSQGQRLPRLPRLPRPHAQEDDAVRACALLDELLRHFGLAYERLKRERAAVDFDDLELLAGELFAQRAGVRASWSDRFALLMVDEFQDTNPRQLAILRALDRGNLFTVGDELQSIYGFRHADVSLFRARHAELEELGASLRLTRNFRSREPLLDVVNAVFAQRFSSYEPLVPGRIDDAPLELGLRLEDERGTEAALGAAAVVPARGTGGTEVELLLTDVRGWEERDELAAAISAGLPHAQLWRQAEARLLAQRVAELVHERRARAGEVVVLLRAAGDLEVFERALQLQGLRTLAAVGAFWGHQQIGDLISYLRALANPLDERALYAVLASPLAGCSRDCLALLADAAREQRRGVWETALAATGDPPAATGDPPAATGDRAEDAALGLAERDRAALERICARLQGERAHASTRTLSELIERAIDASGYREHVLGLDWPERRLANVHKLLRLARRFEASEGRDLRGFLDHVEYLQQSVKVEPDAPVEGVQPDAVRLMTIHAAKGLEFPVVCVADLGRQPNTQTPDLLVDGERVGLRLMCLDGSASTPSLDYEELCRERREREAEEEDRILYVAMTRARERLLLSGALDFARWPGPRLAPTPISWLGPALSQELPALVQAGDAAAVHDLPIESRGSAVVRCRLSSAATVGAVLRLERVDGCSRPGEAVADGEVALAAGPIAGQQLSIYAEGAPSSIRAGRAVDTIATQVGGCAAHGAGRGAEHDAEHETEHDTEHGAEHDTGRDAEHDAGRGAEYDSANCEASSAGAGATPPLLGTLSYTSLSELERCGYRFYLERFLALPEDRVAARAAPERGGLEARTRGTLIHRLMETVDPARSSPASPDDVAAQARELGLRVGEAERVEIARLIEVASAAELAGRVAAARDVRREHPFAFSPGPALPLITGVIDLLASEANGGRLVIDYKSDRVGAEVDLEALVQREYGVQRLLYALAVLREGVASVEIVHWFLERPREWVGARYAAADREHLERRLAARVRHAAERGYAVSPRPHRELCLTCPGRAGLCSWPETETLRDAPEQERAGPIAADP